MKPTKEQLADPKWWDKNSNCYDYVFYNEENGSHEFADKNGETKDFSLITADYAWVLLAKRPGPDAEKCKPKVPSLPDIGTEVEIVDNCSLVYGQGESGEVIGHIENCAIVRMSYGLGCFEASYLKIKKTQREELIDIVMLNLNMGVGASGVTEAILYRFDLTEKNGE